MTIPPKAIGGAKLLYYTLIDERHRPTGKTAHRVNGVELGPASGLAICRYDEEDGFYLFYCDPNWEAVTDTWHQSLNDAKEQAEFEYRGVSQTWQSLY